MNFKKLKLATGVIGLLGVVFAVVCYILSLIIANAANTGGQETGWNMFGIAIVFIIFGIPLAIAAVVELIFSILYIAKKFNRRAFYIVGAVLCIFDLLICFILAYFTISITQSFGEVLVPLINVVCILLILVAVVLKIICAVKFKKEENIE